MAYAEKRGKKWRGRYRDANGEKQSAGYFNTKKEALTAAQKLEHKVIGGGWSGDRSAGKMTFSTYFEEHWLPERQIGKNTVAQYRSFYNSSLKEAFGEVALRDISEAQIQRWVNAQVRAGGAPGTVEAKYKLLALVLGGTKGVSAVRDKIIEVSPCRGIELPTYVKPEKVVYDVDEVEALMAQVDEWWQPLPMLAAESGLRVGELLGLEVRDIVDRVVHVNRTIIELRIADTDTGTRFETKPWPKGKKRRKVKIAPEIDVMLQALIRERKLFGNDRLFSMPGSDGLPRRTAEWPQGLPPSRAYLRCIWVEAHELAGVPRVVDESRRTFHSLRGSHISWLLAGGADPTAVQNRAGHAKLSTTQVYVDPMKDADDRALEALDSYKKRRKSG